MTSTDRGPSVSGGAGATDRSTLPPADGGIHMCQDAPRDAPALPLIHGSASSARAWNPLVPLLTGSHRVIRIDLPGHGRSAEPATAATRSRTRHAGPARHWTGSASGTLWSSGNPAAARSPPPSPNSGPGPDAFVAPQSAEAAPAQWPPTDEQLRHFASTAVSRAGRRIPEELLYDVRGMTRHAFTTSMRATRSYLGGGRFRTG